MTTLVSFPHLLLIVLGNKKYASYVLKSNEAVFVVSSPYPSSIDQEGSVEPYPNFTHDRIIKFVNGTVLLFFPLSLFFPNSFSNF